MRQDGVSRNVFSEVFGKAEFAKAFYFYEAHDLCENETSIQMEKYGFTCQLGNLYAPKEDTGGEGR